ncbi:MAG: methylenetetrahydrofolate reductase [NAD(P)H] [Actinobacteria bacterium]|nr:methylenetetrahydrofolate reductase [NAD(P)H] [Actinomycetota bacterium]MCB9412283.1 methylenetetrahydrofolate reductase [NAD(P)H] [Actinomycetota bacterium]
MSFSVAQHVAEGGKSFSFEFFPPKTDVGERNLWHTINELHHLAPTFVSVTYGAGGSTRDRTIRLTGRIAQETDLLPVGHLTCVGSSREELAEIVDAYSAAGVHHVLALRGDPPGGLDAPWESHPGGLEHADELVRLVDSRGDFTVGVAAFPEGHPEAPSLDDDAKVLLRKQEAGADFAITQFFFNADDYFRLVDRANRIGVDIPILPGIMPVTNVSQIRRFAKLSGAEFPADLADRFLALGDDPEAVIDMGVEVAAQMCRTLLDEGAPGLHFYTLNRSNSTLQVFRELGLEAT